MYMYTVYMYMYTVYMYNFGFNIVNFPHLYNNIPTKPAYEMYISQLIRIGRICNSFKNFADRHYMLTTHLIQQGL